MRERQTLTGAIMAALAEEVSELHPSLTYEVARVVARVAARVAVENLPLVVGGAMPEELEPQTRPALSVVEDVDEA